MLKSFLNNKFHRIKRLLLHLKPVAEANRFIKADQLRRGLRSLAASYEKLAKTKNFQYSEFVAVNNFKRRLKYISPLFTPKKTGELRIFWVGANRDQDESGFLQALRRLATVIEFHNWKGGYGQWFWDECGHARVYDPKIVALNDSCLKLQIDTALKDGSIDLLMGQMWANFLSKEALEYVRGHGIPVINISMDDRLPNHWKTQCGVRLGSVGLASVSDLVLTTSPETCTWYGIEGCPAIFWPLASEPSVFAPSQFCERDIDVLFIGNKYGIRESIIKDLHKHKIRVECYGAGWPNGPATAEQSAQLFKRAKIILGVGTVGYCDDVFTLKLRDFDAPMSGAMYLTHRSPDIARLYNEGKEIECYLKSDEAAHKINHYLAHPVDLEAVATAGHLKALSRHTWLNRIQTTFEQIGLLGVLPAIDAPSQLINPNPKK